MAVPPSDARATEIEVYPEAEQVPLDLDDFMEVEERSTPMGSKMPAAREAEDSTREALEARLIYETRAIGERRRALAGREWARETRRVDAVGDLKSTLKDLIAPPPPPEATPSAEGIAVPVEPPPVETPAALPAPMGAVRVATPALSTARHETRSTRAIRLRIGIVRVIGVLLFLGIVVGFGVLLREHDPGLIRTRAAIAGFFRALLH